MKQQGRQDRQQHRADYHGRRINPGKAGDEVFGPGFFIGGVLHKLQDFSGGALLEAAHGFDPDNAGEVDRAAEDPVAGSLVGREAFAGEGRRIDGSVPFQNGAVQRDSLAGADDDLFPGLHVLGGDSLFLPFPEYSGRIGPEVHECRNGAAALPDGKALKQLTDLIKDHDSGGLGVLPDDESADRGERHQKALVKNLPVHDIPPGF